MDPKKAKPKFRHWIPKLLGVNAIVLYPFIFFVRSKEYYFYHGNSDTYAKRVVNNIPIGDTWTGNGYRILKHEFVHIYQVQRLGWFKFYLSYIFGGKRKYESEAEAVQFDPFTKEEIEALESWGLDWELIPAKAADEAKRWGLV